ncbi:uncharacterized protein J3R85_019585 [Psidium guajava]|nr:uncharacterized protein J3R85_019585 [Psidium guajava]
MTNTHRLPAVPLHFFSACSGAGFDSGGSPLSMQLLHRLSTQPSMSLSPLPPKCLPPHRRAMIPATTPMIVIAASTTTSVSMDRLAYLLDPAAGGRGGGGSASGVDGQSSILQPRAKTLGLSFSLSLAEEKPNADSEGARRRGLEQEIESSSAKGVSETVHAKKTMLNSDATGTVYC